MVPAASTAAATSALLEDGACGEEVMGEDTGWLRLDGRRHVEQTSRSQVLRTGSLLVLGFAGVVLLAVMAERAVTRSATASAERSVVSLLAVKQDEEDEKLEKELDKLEKLDQPSTCKDATHGSNCYRDVEYALDHIKAHPDWYVGLQETSNFKDVQAFMHRQHTKGGKSRCPKPCNYVPKEDVGHRAIFYGKCHTARKGEDCYNHVIYTMKEALPKHPEWYPGLDKVQTGQSGFETVQNYLHKQRVCPEPCNVQDPAKMTKGKCRKLSSAKKRRQCFDKIAKASSSCRTAIAGDRCYGDILWAKDHVKAHGEWYKGLTVDSTFDEIQAFLHKQHSKNCRKPCNTSAVKALEHVDLESSCHTAPTGSACYKSVLWVISDGLDKHPDWYANLTKNSTFEQIQTRLVQNKDKHCPRDPCPCQTAQEGDKCFKAIRWVQMVGLENHSSWYEGLNENSTFEEFQMRLHQDKHPLCALPCQRSSWLADHYSTASETAQQ